MAETTKIVAKPGQADLWIERWFDAPMQVVFEATKNPDLVRRWWGPRDQKMTSCEIDFRVGGGWRFVLGDAAFHGVYKEIVPYTRVVDTWVYEGASCDEAQEVAMLEERECRTRLALHLVFGSVEARDRMIESGMQRGLTDSHERLDEVLADVLRTSRGAAAAPKAADRRSS
jgi:uncharacterized protein YndB with AHSA1/START domain